MSLARLTNNWLLDFSGDDPPEAAETRSQQMASFARHTPINSLVSLTMSLVAALSLWHGGGHILVLPWAGLIWAVGLWHLFKWWRHRDMPRPMRVSGRGLQKTVAWSFLAGLLWGSTVLLYPQVSDPQRLLLMITAVGMAAGATTTLGAIPVAAAAFITAAVFPWIGLFLVQSDVEHFALACMALIFMLAMLGTTRIVYAGFIKSVRTRRANEALLTQFHSERDEWFEISDTTEAFALFDDRDCLLLWNENYRRILSLPEESLYRGAARKQLLRLCAAPVEVVEGRLTREQWVDRHLRLQDEAGLSSIEQLSNGRWLKSSARRTSLDQTVTLHVDVTMLKSQESALIESEARFQAFLEHAPVELGIKDLEGRYVFVSRDFERMQGISNEDVQGKRAGEIYSPEVAEELRAHDESVIRSGQPSQREIVVSHDDGARVFLTVKFPIRDADGEVAGIGAVSTDITERKRAESELERSRALLSEAVEALADGFVIFDSEERMVLCNSRYRQMLQQIAGDLVPGVSLQEVSSKTAEHCLGLSTRAEIDAWVQDRMARLRSGGGSFEQELTDGRWIRIRDDHLPNGWTVGIRTDITELKQRQMALEESERRFRSIADDTPIMLWVFDAQDKLIFHNRTLLEFHGLSMEQALVWNHLEDVHPQDRARIDALEDEWRERPRPQNTEYRLRCADGSYRWVLDVSIPRWADDGTYLGSIGTYVDINDQKQAQDALRESERRFQDFAESSADWFWEMDADLRFTYISPNVERIVGAPPEWHYGKSRADILGEDFDRGIWDAHLRSLRAREPFRDLVYPRAGEGVEPRWLRTSGVPVFGEDGTFLGYRGSGSDVTAAVEAQQALKASEEQLRLVTDSLPVLIAYCDRDETYLFVNKTCEEWHARPRQELIGESIRTLVPEIYDDIKPRIEAVLSGHRATFGKSITYGDGKTRDVQVLYVPRFDEAGEVEGYFVLAEDVSERKRAEEALRERETRLYDLQRQLEHVSRISAMGHLSSALAHELNQPLTAVMNYAQAARRILNANGGVSSPKVEEMIDKATTQAGRAGDVIRRLKGLFEKGETEVSRESINEVIEDAASLALVDAGAQEISYKLKLMENVPPVMIDKIQIQQVVLNLVRNAVEALAGASRRELVIETLQLSGGGVEVAVCDSGPGLSAEIEKRMFEPFVTGKPGNMGVGLSISNRIIEAHGGRLWAESNAGGGTRFRFTLPSMKRGARKHEG